MNTTFMFNKIKRVYADGTKYSNDDTLVVYGDSLEQIKKIPDYSISLILTDPPYHSTKKKIFLEIRHLVLIANILIGWKNIQKSGKEF